MFLKVYKILKITTLSQLKIVRVTPRFICTYDRTQPRKNNIRMTPVIPLHNKWFTN